MAEYVFRESSPPEGTCPVCGLWHYVFPDGRLVAHYNRATQARCAGSLQPAVWSTLQIVDTPHEENEVK
jgi:hypothetical protein